MIFKTYQLYLFPTFIPGHPSLPCLKPSQPLTHASSPAIPLFSMPQAHLFPLIPIGFQGFRASRLQGFKALGLQGFRASGRAAATTTAQDHGLPGQVPSPHAPRSNISRSGVPLTPIKFGNVRRMIRPYQRSQTKGLCFKTLRESLELISL